MVTYKTNYKNGHWLVYSMAGIFIVIALVALIGCGEKKTEDTQADQTAAAIDSIPSLQAQLDSRKAEMMAKVPDSIKQVMQTGLEDIFQTGITDRALQVGDPIPRFTLPNATGDSITISSILQQGPVVLMFYRGGWCPYCNMQLAAMQDILPEIKAKGARLVAISPEVPDSSLSTKERHQIGFEVLSDADNGVAKQFNLVFTMPEELSALYKQFGINLNEYNGTDADQLPIPATYVITPDGFISYAFVDVDYTKRAEPKVILEELDKFIQ